MKKIGVLLFLLSNTLWVNAQYNEGEREYAPHASNVFLEGLGLGLFYSLNYDQRIQAREDGLGFRIGVGGAGGKGTGYIAVPAQLNYLLGGDGKYFEIGAGASFFHLSSNFLFNDEQFSTVVGTATFGFRRQPHQRNGFTWRIAFNPLISGGTIQPWGGASVGYRF